MKTTLFYFSATGNSLSIARKLANDLGNCEFIAIPKVINQETIEVKTERAGIIFPVYAWGMPRIVDDFIHKLIIDKECYFFAITTCCAISGNTLVDLSNLLRSKGNKLNSGFVLKAPSGSLMKLNALDRMIMRLDKSRFNLKGYEERKTEIVDCIKNLNPHKPESSNRSANLFGSFFHQMGINSFKSKDGEFIIEANCNQCGTCSKVCPRGNINISSSGPMFSHNCELCHACIQWCPKFAIKHKDFDQQKAQYRNSEVNVNDLKLN